MTHDRAMELARVAADEYRRLRLSGDVVLAQMERQSIEDLVGRYVDGKLTLPEEISRRMYAPDSDRA